MTGVQSVDTVVSVIAPLLYYFTNFKTKFTIDFVQRKFHEMQL